MTALAGALLVLGLVVGSFLNVVVQRLPRGESLVRPGSRCPACGAAVKPYDNVPLLSWLLLRGRCRSCGARISPRYPAIELLTGALFAGTALAKEPAWLLVMGLVFVTMLVAVAAIDLEHRIIPNRILLAGALAGMAIAAVGNPGGLVERGIATAAAGAFLLVVSLAYSGGMGMGDVKLGAVMGLFLGRAVAPALLAGFAAGALAGIAIMLRRGAGARKQAVPFGPFLALGGVIGLWFGPQLVDAYLDSFFG